MVHIVLSDNGPGIQPEQLPHLFEPFFTTREEGTGIGLAISKTIIESHDGRIMADNNSQGGATFEIALNTFLQEHEQA
jgi:C4-dicarboxylate-specific signal transduction histidine kinase